MFLLYQTVYQTCTFFQLYNKKSNSKTVQEFALHHIPQIKKQHWKVFINIILY
jgi:hypothetical protein